MHRLLPRLLLALQLLGVTDFAPPPAREAHACCCSGEAATVCAGACECACGAPMPGTEVRAAGTEGGAGECRLLRGRCGRSTADSAPAAREPYERPLAPRPQPGHGSTVFARPPASRPAPVSTRPPSPPPRD